MDKEEIWMRFRKIFNEDLSERDGKDWALYEADSLMDMMWDGTANGANVYYKGKNYGRKELLGEISKTMEYLNITMTVNEFCDLLLHRDSGGMPCKK